MPKKGPVNVFICYVAWGLLPLFWRYLGELSSLAVLGYRILFSLLFMTACLLCTGRWSAALASLRDRRELGWLVASGLTITVNWGSFIWAVNSGHVLDSSLAYYMYPILSVMVGALFFRERLSPLQWAAVGLMAAGVTVTAAGHGQVPWLALVIGGSFVVYGVLKRNVKSDAATSLFAESLVASPLALACVLWCEWAGSGAIGQLRGAQWLLLPAAGVVTAVPLLFFSRGIRTTSNTLAGVLMLVNPTLQLLVGVFVLGEPFTTAHAVLFAFIWGGLALFLAGNFLHRHKRAETGQ